MTALLVDPIDPRIAKFLAPTPAPATPAVVVGMERPTEPGSYFVFDGTKYDNSPVGTVYADPVRGKLVRRQDPGLFGAPINYGLKV